MQGAAEALGAALPARARVDLAAVYRLVAHHGWDDVIYNHCSMRAPGEPRKFLMNWDGPPNNRWRKMYKGTNYVVTCQELDADKTLPEFPSAVVAVKRSNGPKSRQKSLFNEE